MFPVRPPPSPVVAVTAGMAKLKDRTIASYAEEFCEIQTRKDDAKKLVNVKPICRAFLQFMRKRYVSHYRGS